MYLRKVEFQAHSHHQIDNQLDWVMMRMPIHILSLPNKVIYYAHLIYCRNSNFCCQYK